LGQGWKGILVGCYVSLKNVVEITELRLVELLRCTVICSLIISGGLENNNYRMISCIRYLSIDHVSRGF